MLDKQPCEVARADPKAIGQLMDANPVKDPALDKNQGALDGCLGSFPRGAERRRFGTTSKARAKSVTLSSCRTAIELHIARKWRSRRADGSAVDARSLNPHEHHTIECWVAPAKGIIQSGEVEHGPAIPTFASQIEFDEMTRSENDRWRVDQTSISQSPVEHHQRSLANAPRSRAERSLELVEMVEEDLDKPRVP